MEDIFELSIKNTLELWIVFGFKKHLLQKNSEKITMIRINIF